MKRIRMKLTIEGPVGGAKQRLINCICDAGYTVTVSAARPCRGSLVVVADVLAPHGEVSATPAFKRPRSRIVR